MCFTANVASELKRADKDILVYKWLQKDRTGEKRKLRAPIFCQKWYLKGYKEKGQMVGFVNQGLSNVKSDQYKVILNESHIGIPFINSFTLGGDTVHISTCHGLSGDGTGWLPPDAPALKVEEIPPQPINRIEPNGELTPLTENPFEKCWSFEVLEGFHSLRKEANPYSYYCYVQNSHEPKLYACVIPKGALYIENYGEAVSNQIIVLFKRPATAFLNIHNILTWIDKIRLKFKLYESEY